MKRTVISTLLTLFLTAVYAQESELTLESIYSSGEFRSEWFGQLQWFDGGDAYTTLDQDAEGQYSLVRNDTRTGESEVIVSKEMLIPAGETSQLSVEGYEWSADKTKLLIFTNTSRVWRYNTKGDYWVLDLKDKSLTKLGGADAEPSTLMFAKFSPSGDRVGYVRAHNIYIETLSDKKITQLTTDGSDRIINGTFDWAYEEEFSCRDGFRWSPDGTKIAYWRIDATDIKEFLMINNTDDIYSYVIPVQYPKAGEKPSEAKIGVVNATGGATTWMLFEGDPRNNYLPRMIWHPDSKSVLVQHINRAQNHNRVTSCDISNGVTTVVYEDKETAWLEAVDDFQFTKEGDAFTWVSEKSGWKSIYLVAGGKEQLISPANYDMVSVQLIDEKGGWLYFMASPNDATQRYLYRTRLNGKGEAKRLSPGDQSGTHTYQISPNGKYARHSYSKAGVPPIIDLISLPDHKVIKTFVNNQALRDKLATIDLNEIEFFTVDNGEGVSLDAYMIKPSGFDPSKKYPVLFHVYGEPWGQTVLDSYGWSNYLWHQMLSQQGYLIMSVDNRGTPGPKGREWRKCVYGQIGVLSSADQAAALENIKKQYDFVDGDRIGIWGWSGGGSMTLNMMFRYPDLYHTGMSVAPVPDQRLYDNIYQERYSGVPQDMPESYENGSPITYAKNLKGNLLVVHGTGDDNVHYQGTERLINELVKHNKLFSMMAYPNRSHGIYEGVGTTRHLRETLTNYLRTNLPAGGR
ncbi:MAG: S9 family peptidase [Cyclobacteriaceae bacterium]